MIDGKDIFVQMNGEWIPAKEYDLSVQININPKLFYQVWDIETLQRLLASAIEKEEYEIAKVINVILVSKKKKDENKRGNTATKG